MFAELHIICGLDPIPDKLGVAREILVFLDHLHRIAARPAVDPVGLVGATAPARLGPVIIIAVVVAAATATALPVVHVQLKHPVEKLCQTPFGRPRSLCRSHPAYPAGSCPSPPMRAIRTNAVSGKQDRRTQSMRHVAPHHRKGPRSGL